MAKARKARVVGFNHVALEVGDVEAAFRVAEATRFCGDAVMRYLAREDS